MLSSEKIRVGVLRGGPSPEYLISLETGKNVLQNLPEEYYDPVDIFISKNGDWHDGGLVRNPIDILRKVDVVWNGLHGAYGEDGTVQKMLSGFHMPYTGSDALSSALGMNKIASKKIYKDSGLKTPFSVSIPLEALTRAAMREVYEQVPAPWVVKPATAGSSVGVRIVHSLPELEESILAAYEYSPQVLVEEFIRGVEAHVPVFDNYRGREFYSSIPVSNSPLSSEEKELIQHLARMAHQSLGLHQYSSSDFIVHPKRGIFILETDVLPPLHEQSNLRDSLESIGAKFSDFLHHIIQSVLQGR